MDQTLLNCTKNIIKLYEEEHRYILMTVTVVLENSNLKLLKN